MTATLDPGNSAGTTPTASPGGYGFAASAGRPASREEQAAVLANLGAALQLARQPKAENSSN